MDGAELYAGNAAAMWASLAPLARLVPGTPPGAAVFDIPAQQAGRIILRWPGAAGPGQLGALMTAAGRRLLHPRRRGRTGRLLAGDPPRVPLPRPRPGRYGRRARRRPGRPAVLVATAAGQPLYASLGFAAVAEAAWYRFALPAG